MTTSAKELIASMLESLAAIEAKRPNVPHDMTMTQETKDEILELLLPRPSKWPGVEVDITPRSFPGNWSFVGIPIVIDPEVPPGEVRMRNADGEVIQVVNIRGDR